MSEYSYSDSSPAGGATSARIPKVDAHSEHAQGITDVPEVEVEQSSDHRSTQEFENNFDDELDPGNDPQEDLENAEDFESAEDNVGAHSDSSDDLEIELVANASKHITNFLYEEHEDGNVYLTVNGEKKDKERARNSIMVPQLLLKPGGLTADEQNANKYFDPKSKNCYWKHGEETHFASHFMDEAETEPCHADMKRFQDLSLAHPQSSYENLTNGIEGNGQIHLGISVEQGKGSIQPHVSIWPRKSPKQKTRDCISDPVTTELVKLFASIVTRLLKLGLPPAVAENLRRRGIEDVSFSAGNEDNLFTSTLQVNVSLIDQDLTESIGAGGGAHIDRNDDIGRVNIVIFMSHPPPDYCPGKFLLLNDRTYCITRPYTALISSGAMPHWPILPKKYQEDPIRHEPAGPTPASPESLDFRRLSAVAYPHKVPMTKASANLKPIMFQPGSLLVYGTLRNQNEYQARLRARAVRDSAEEEGRVVLPSEVDGIVQRYSWVEDGKAQYPREELISETVFGPGDSETAFNARRAFIMKHVHCGFTMPGGTRATTAKLVDDAGNEIPEEKVSKTSTKRGQAPVEDSENEYEDASTTKRVTRASKKRAHTQIEENEAEYKEPSTANRATRAAKKRG